MADHILEQLQSLVGQEHVYGQITPYLVTPPHQEALAAIVAVAHQNSWPIAIQGRGSKKDWGKLVNEPTLLLSTAKLDRLIEHAAGDLTVTAQAGIAFSELQAHLAVAGQGIAIDPPYANRATLGGVVATGESGSWRHRYLGVRDQVLGIQFVRADGKVAKAGGRVVKNVAGYDLMKLLTGSYGTLAIITQITMRLYPLAPDRRGMVIWGDRQKIAALRLKLLQAPLTPTMLDILSPALLARLSLGNGNGWGIAIRFEGIAASTTAQMNMLTKVVELANLLYLELPNCTDFWQSVQAVFWNESANITCKLGLTPANAIEICQRIGEIHPLQIYAGSGLGVIQMQQSAVPDPIKTLQEWRTSLEAVQGFLTILEAPLDIKTAVDPWGYRPETKQLMSGLRQQFDPTGLLNPNRC